MRSIPLLAVNATEVFDQIATAKRQPRRGQMLAARGAVLGAYVGYEDAAPNVGGLAAVPLSDQQRGAMQHAFNVETAPMTALRGELLSRVSVVRCPFCGISESSTLDHYLPKEKYPEFAVFPKNLVPSCAVCNTRKRDRVLIRNTNVRMFLHPCYDEIPNSEFVAANVRMAPTALILSYRLVQPAGMALETFQSLQAHFKALDLADRYRLMGLEHLGGQYPALRRAYSNGGDPNRVAEKLLEVAEDFEEVHGPNYWLAKLYRALNGNGAFCAGGFEVVRARA